MQNDNKNSIGLSSIVIIIVCVTVLILAFICFFVFKDKYLNDEEKLDTNQSVSDKKEDESNTQNNETSSPSKVSTENTETSSKTNPLSVGKWGVASKRSSGNYVDVPVRVTNIKRGTQAAQEYKNYCESQSSIYKYEDAKEGMEWAIVEYDVDLTGFSSDVKINLDSKISGTGDNRSIKYNNKTYIVSTVNMTSDYASGKIATARFATQLPIGCSEYIIALGSSSSTQAFIMGK